MFAISQQRFAEKFRIWGYHLCIIKVQMPQISFDIWCLFYFCLLKKYVPRWLNSATMKLVYGLLNTFPIGWSAKRKYSESSRFSTFSQKCRKRRQFADDKYAQSLEFALELPKYTQKFFNIWHESRCLIEIEVPVKNSLNRIKSRMKPPTQSKRQKWRQYSARMSGERDINYYWPAMPICSESCESNSNLRVE